MIMRSVTLTRGFPKSLPPNSDHTLKQTTTTSFTFHLSYPQSTAIGHYVEARRQMQCQKNITSQILQSLTVIAQEIRV